MRFDPQQITLSLVFPAYYDEKNIGIIASQAVEVCEKLKLKDYEVIIVEDGSPDRTAEVVDDLARKFSKVRVIHHEKNMGYGRALCTGFLAAKMDRVFYSDGDAQFDLEDLRPALGLLGEAEFIAGYRVKKQYTVFRLLSSWGYNQIIRALFKVTIRDVNCAFKIFPREFLGRIEIESKDGFIAAELATKARALGYRFAELPVSHLPRPDGASTVTKPGFLYRSVLEIIDGYRKYRPLLPR